MAVTVGEWRDAMILNGIAADGEYGGDLRAFVHERLLERLLATFRGHKSPRVRLIAGRLWLMHQEPSQEPPQPPEGTLPSQGRFAQGAVNGFDGFPP